MSWFQNLTGALSGGASNNASSNSGSSSSSGGSNDGGTSVPTTFDASGNPVGDAGNSAGNSAGTSSAPAPAPAPATKSVEELLFAPAPAPATPPAPAPNQGDSKGNQKQTVNELAPGLTSQQLIQNLQSVNFMGAVPPEVLQSALGGDQTAFGQVMSSVAQMSAAIAVQQAIVASNAAMDKRFTDFDGSLTSKIGESKFADVLADPKFSNPFVRPLAENLIGRLRANDASITPDQIKQVLPRLIEHAMKQFPTGSDQGSNPQLAALMQGNKGRNVPTEVKFDELFS